MPSPRKPSKLLVVFDTSIITNDTPYHLVRHEVRQLILDSSKHSDLEILFHIPQMVLDERTYQMRKKAEELLPPLGKIEKILGHKLAITEDVLKEHITTTIQKQIKELSILILPLETDDVDWAQMIQRAVYRQPPFEDGTKEKGFRDAIIGETFVQLVKGSPTTPDTCRLALITDDDLLEAFIQEKTQDLKNVRILDSVNALEGLINTLVSDATEAFIEDIRPRAAEHFFVAGDKTTLYFKENVGSQILERFQEQLLEVPKPHTYRNNTRWLVNAPYFVKKEGRRIYWNTDITVEGKLHTLATPMALGLESPLANLGLGSSAGSLPGTGAGSLPGIAASSLPGTGVGSLAAIAAGIRGVLDTSPPERIPAGTVTTQFEVSWSFNVSEKRHNLTASKIHDIRFLETTWDIK